MKNTDTILGAFGILGIILLVMFAVSGSADKPQADEVVLDSEATEEVKLNDPTTKEAEEVAVSSENDEVILNNEGLKNGVTGLFNTARPTDETTGFTQSNTEVALNGSLEGEEAVSSNSDQLETETELVNNTEVNEQNVSDNSAVQEETLTTNDSDEDNIAVDENKKPGRISKFFTGIFGNDKDKNNTPDNVGGSTEDTEMSDNEDVVGPGSYVVKSGDNLWDILRTSGMSAAQTANYINDLRGDQSAMTDAGITSGNVDLIYVGQVLEL